MKKTLVTGCSGFIGFHLCIDLLKKRKKVLGVDSLNNYYSTKLKLERLKILKKFKNFSFIKTDIAKYRNIEKVFVKNNFDIIFHLASQPGVMYSYINPKSYKDNNINATQNLAKLARKFCVKKIIFTSSSSVYGDQKKFPTNEKAKLKPKNYYAITKIECEKILTEIFYQKDKNFLFIVRPFTVYGEYGRPDMLFIQVMKNIFLKKKINVYNHGNYIRDFTYVKDVSKALISLINYKLKNKIIMNISASKPIKIIDFIIEILKLKNFDRNNYKKIVYFFPKRKGEVIKTFGSNTLQKKITKIYKHKDYKKGLENTYKWYLNYKNKKDLYF